MGYRIECTKIMTTKNEKEKEKKPLLDLTLPLLDSIVIVLFVLAVA